MRSRRGVRKSDRSGRKLAGDGRRFETVIESIVTSRQFLNKRGREQLTANATDGQ